MIVSVAGARARLTHADINAERRDHAVIRIYMGGA
jgi:hypothetical protein